MRHGRWGPDGPPPEAYSRVTNPERFAPLHAFAEELLARLASEYDVEREEGHGLEPTRGPDDLARSSVRLVPRSQRASPLQISFTKFPGLIVRAGRWYWGALPACGCDACDETAESTIDDLTFLVENVTRGHFTEEVSLPQASGDGWKSTEIGDRASGRSGTRGSRVPRADALEMLHGSRKRYPWEPWPKR